MEVLKMGRCKDSCRLCRKLVISTAVTWNGTNVVVTIPAGSYLNNEKYCIVVSQPIPAAATINSTVLIQIGTGAQTYPLTNCNCRPFLAKDLSTRTRYSVCVETTPTSAVFRFIGRQCCKNDSNLVSVNGTAPVVTTGGGENA